ncbi:MAG: hypothetical protein JSR77_06050 [Planctomycetes bacterium]|nr:hypothetical protein [Planctomycetota bacterium]
MSKLRLHRAEYHDECQTIPFPHLGTTRMGPGWKPHLVGEGNFPGCTPTSIANAERALERAERCMMNLRELMGDQGSEDRPRAA